MATMLACIAIHKGVTVDEPRHLKVKEEAAVDLLDSLFLLLTTIGGVDDEVYNDTLYTGDELDAGVNYHPDKYRNLAFLQLLFSTYGYS